MIQESSIREISTAAASGFLAALVVDQHVTDSGKSPVLMKRLPQLVTMQAPSLVKLIEALDQVIVKSDYLVNLRPSTYLKKFGDVDVQSLSSDVVEDLIVLHSLINQDAPNFDPVFDMNFIDRVLNAKTGEIS